MHIIEIGAVASAIVSIVTLTSRVVKLIASIQKLVQSIDQLQEDMDDNKQLLQKLTRDTLQFDTRLTHMERDLALI